jgi:hypothetical protein
MAGFQTMSGIPKVTSTANFYSNTNPLLQGRGIGGFAQPSALFGNNEQGAWWDFSDFDSMYQEDTCITKAALESTVGFVADKRVQTRGPELNLDPNFQTPAAWSPNSTLPATSVVTQGHAVLNSPDGSSATLFNTAGAVLTVGKYYEFTLFINKCTGTPVVFCGSALTQAIPVGATGYIKFILKADGTSPAIKRTGGQPCYLDISQFSVRELIGNHLIQPTAGARPMLSRRYNQALNTDAKNIAINANWGVSSGTLVAGLYTQSNANSIQRVQYGYTGLLAGANYRVRGRIKQNGVRYLFLNAGGALGVACAIDLATGTNTLTGTVNTSLAIDGYIDFYFDGVSGLAANTFYLQAQQSLATGDQTYVGDGVSGFQIDKLDIRLTADANLSNATISISHISLCLRYSRIPCISLIRWCY